MENYENIMKLVDKQLGEQESVIEYYRDKQKEWEERCAELTHTNLELNKVNDILKEKIARLEEKIAQYETPKKVANV